MKYISVVGAKEHNLKNISLKIPRDQLVVFTGVSGSGKSTLAFDTIYAEGQRRYIESLSSYARMFLGNSKKPNVEKIEGLSPAVSIDQKTTNRNPRSTVGTVTEIFDYLRLLYARIGIPHCPKCGKEITSQSIDQIVDRILELPTGTKFMILSPLVRGEKGQHKKLISRLKKDGYVRAVIDGQLHLLSEKIELKKNVKHQIDVVVDRLKKRENMRERLTDSVEIALNMSDGLVKCQIIDGESQLYSEKLSCPDCGFSMEELEPRSFSFNNPYGMCPVCNGLGFHKEVDQDLLIPDRSLSINEGAIKFFGLKHDNRHLQSMLKSLLKKYGYDFDTPIKEMSDACINEILYGSDDEMTVIYDGKFKGTYTSKFEGLINNMERRFRETKSNTMRGFIERYMSNIPCPACHGKRLNDTILSVTVSGKNIIEFTELHICDALKFLNNLSITEHERLIAHQIIVEIKNRLQFLVDVGLDYLTLSRSAETLSGGESQRIRLATQIGTGLTGVLYVLDEPSIGLHQRDNHKLLNSLRKLTDLGNSLIVVEHDEETIREADWIVDIGPKAGVHGGEVIAEGKVEDIIKSDRSITGKYLSGEKQIPIPSKRRAGNGKTITVFGAEEHNLKKINVKFPLGKLIVVTGVSGSGKSTLVNEILYNGISRHLYHSYKRPGKHKRISGIENIDKIIAIDQAPIGRTPRSNPATYTGLFDLIRDLFASTNEAKARGYKKGRFSFNVKGGRCETCHGDGIIKIEMHFLPDVYVPCEVCKGTRYNRETLDVKFKGKNIAEILDLTVDEALEFFSNLPRLKRKLQTLHDVGLGYIKLGQPSTQLSGGEAQRVKLSTELSKQNTGNTLYILDEPTTGLHMDDVAKLVKIMHTLVDRGNTVVVIEHQMDVIKVADHIIDLGPEGGENGGTIVAEGTPEEVAANPNSYTGYYLKEILNHQKR
ncbi:excinuclease ABC subunit UvrA [Pseudoramibacter sp.]|jgi:excinuclease ABC subunit A|uniref:excinuclease ABC subunit UvrA n=1 Tax=Pseudoramibacter sp. TaxID=2034862 RepID=UPI0025DA454E|nr:excinuclease ABC subunit UvrA [Pseudoramibacter sp.]MCH4072808.1 excinuclease ABC subunit UvrA [Pseudoramibacter sp.]MCH4106579.1 excinuclease ABC subunit UvrA [Pseudoramibacter sp.]